MRNLSLANIPQQPPPNLFETSRERMWRLAIAGILLLVGLAAVLYYERDSVIAMAQKYYADKQSADLVRAAKTSKQRGDYRSAYEDLLQAAAYGNEDAQAEIGVYYSPKGLFLRQDNKINRAWFIAASEKSPWAAFVLARELLAEQDVDGAEKYLKVAADGSDILAKLYLGGLSLHPKYGRQNFERAFGYLLQAAEGENTVARFLVADLYGKGQGVALSGASSRYWQTLAEEDQALASQLARLYYEDVLVPRDYAVAARYFAKAAEGKSGRALYDYAIVVQNGEGVPADEEQAVKLFTQAAEQGEKNAMIALANIYRYQGKPELALPWLERAQDDGAAAYILGNLYELGQGVPVNKDKAIELYDKSCAQGEWIGCGYGALLKKDKAAIEEVFNFYHGQCEGSKDVSSCYNLACLHSLNGDNPAAIAALTRAVDFGFADAAHAERDPDLAAVRGTPEYQNVLGKIKVVR
jgi:TPR repeat protein